MRIGELARRTGVSARSLRYYEQQGLLHASRGASGWREYAEPAVGRVRTIAGLLGDGLTLREVKQLAPCLDGAHEDAEACADPSVPRRAYRGRLRVVERRLAELHESRERLLDRLDGLDGTDRR